MPFDLDLFVKMSAPAVPAPESIPITSPLQAAVARSIELLDRERPGWLSRINVEKLDVGSSWFCPLGKLFQGYQRGMDALSLYEKYGNKVWYAFNTSGQYPYTYPELTAEWKRQLVPLLASRL